MPDLPTNSGGGEDDLFSDSQLTENLLALFSDDPGSNVLVQRARFQTTLLNLTGLFTVEFLPTLQGHIAIDYVALQIMMERFHRDAFGVKWFAQTVKASDAELVSDPGKLFVLREVKKLGVSD
jgi:hypothetical protein